jgi:superfamily I DNA/RNA helicase/mRNA-degrading endonuclease RelE of RelBE toxin-antitoxin system
MPWNICLSTTFIKDISILPQSVAKTVARCVRLLEEDPYSSGDIQSIRGEKNCYRMRVGGDHRLIYSVRNRWIKLLRVGDRQDIYRWNIGNSDFWREDFEDFEDFDEVSSVATGLFTEEELIAWKIPNDYHSLLLKITDENDLLEVKVPPRYVEIVLDQIFPRSVEEIEAQPEKVASSAMLDQFIDRKIADFWLKLDDNQQEKVDLPTDCPILVKGAPGTGKSVLALHRVKYLLDSGLRRILFTTYSESLVRYSRDLLTSLLGGDPESSGVTVKTVDEIVRDYYPGDSSSLQHPEEVDYLVLESLLKASAKSSFLRRLKCEYILEEFYTIIEARYITTEEEYLDHDRYGRVKGLNKKQRRELWQLYQQWSRRLEELDYISIGVVRQRTLDAIEKNNIKPFDAIVIDECQDLSPVSLRLLVQLIEDPRYLYLTADTSQSLYQRGFAWNYIQDIIRFKNKIYCLRRAYRSTSAITKACLDIIQRDSSGDSETYVTASSLEGELPRIVLKDDWLTNIEIIKNFLTESSHRYSIHRYASAIICPNAQIGELIVRQLRNLQLEARYLEGGDINLVPDCIKVISLENAKGLEFPFVVVVGLEDGVFPNYHSVLEEEKKEFVKQQRRKLYVACSRAMRSLLLYGSHSNPSVLITELENSRNWSFDNG